MTRTRALLSVAAAVSTLACGLAAWSVAAPGGPASDLLPDLDIDAPGGVIVQAVDEAGRRRFRLGFSSQAGNVGAGPLALLGGRPSSTDVLMTATQVIHRSDGGTRSVTDVGTFVYVYDRTHEHWHLLRFMTYELRRAKGFKLVVPDRKTGFCLGDRYNVDSSTTLPGEPPARVYNTNCGPEHPELTEIEEGISVGWGDVYEAWRDAQYVDVTGLPAGLYVLVHRVNPGRPLLESSYANNAASVLLSLTWPRGKAAKPRVRVLAECPDTARCRAGG